MWRQALLGIDAVIEMRPIVRNLSGLQRGTIGTKRGWNRFRTRNEFHSAIALATHLQG